MARMPTYHRPVRRSPTEERKYGDHFYDSKAEMRRAVELDLLVRNGNLDYWIKQVLFTLGPDHSTRVDFLCFDWNDDGALDVWVEEVKGYETPEFRKTRKLWKKYAPVPMHILVPRGTSGWKVEILHGKEQA